LAPFFSALFVSGIVTTLEKTPLSHFKKEIFHPALPNKF